MNYNYGIKSVELSDRYENFIKDCMNGTVEWFISDRITRRIQTFLCLISHIEFKKFDCYCCLYPNATASEYIIFIDIDDMKQALILTTIRDEYQYPVSYVRVSRLKDELLLLSASNDTLIQLRQYLKTDGLPHQA